MNKKILFLLLLSVVSILPVTVHAAAPCDMLSTLKDALVKIGATVVVIGWIIAGILYLTSLGSPEKTGTAKKALIACVIGTLVIILAPSAYQFINDLLNSGGTNAAGCSTSVSS